MVTFVSLSCIVQTLWDLCECQVIIEITVPLLDKNGCTLDQTFLFKNDNRRRFA